MPTITTRLTVWYVAVFGVLLAGVAVAGYMMFAAQRSGSLDDELKNFAEYLEAVSVPDDSRPEDVFEAIAAAARTPRTSFRALGIAVLMRDTVMLERARYPNPDLLSGQLQQIGLDRDKEGLLEFQHGELQYRAYMLHVQRHPRPYSILAITSLERLRESLGMLRTVLLFLVPIALIAAGFGGWGLARRALSPVRDITTTAAAISSTSLDRRVPRSREYDDELTTLADTFNEMIARLDTTFRSQQKFVADASHDFRTPLTVIQTELELMLMGDRSDADVREGIERCLLEIERLNSLASDLLLLARADAGQLLVARMPFRFDELLLECVSQLNHLALSRTLSFAVQIEQPVLITGDEPLFRRAVVNVLDNALKFAEQGSRIDVRVMVRRDRARLIVLNKGPIPPAADLPRLFDRFHRGDVSRSTHGTGLGLAIVHAVVDAHGGTCLARGVEGHGLSIELTVPL